MPREAGGTVAAIAIADRRGGIMEAMSTRFLILAALACGVAILAASAIQILMAR